MKFLCIPCDSAMRLRSTDESEPGSLAVVYACPECGYEMAMLTNPFETQLVRSLGVRIGPKEGADGAPGVAADGSGTAAPSSPSGAVAGEGRCPFSAMLGSSATAGAAAPGPAGAPQALTWTPQALARLEAIPEMVRPMARAGIEMVAREQGRQLVDETLLAEARARFGM